MIRNSVNSGESRKNNNFCGTFAPYVGSQLIKRDWILFLKIGSKKVGYHTYFGSVSISILAPFSLMKILSFALDKLKFTSTKILNVVPWSMSMVNIRAVKELRSREQTYRRILSLS